jgi:hypothetical protein
VFNIAITEFRTEIDQLKKESEKRQQDKVKQQTKNEGFKSEIAGVRSLLAK